MSDELERLKARVEVELELRKAAYDRIDVQAREIEQLREIVQDFLDVVQDFLDVTKWSEISEAEIVDPLYSIRARAHDALFRARGSRTGRKSYGRALRNP